jgi:hypothetical protein
VCRSCTVELPAERYPEIMDDYLEELTEYFFVHRR